MMIRSLLASVLMVAALATGSAAFAEGDAPKKEPSAKQLAQREKMRNCNAKAKEQALKGDARKAFMKDCLSADSPAPQAAKP